LLLPVVLLLAWPRSFAFSIRMIMEPSLLGLLSFLLFANVTLVIFNMLPAFPLDGGRVFRAGLALFLNYGRATNIAINIGRLLAIGLGLAAIYTGQIFTAMIAFFIFIAGGQEGQAVAVRHLLRNVQARQALSTNSVALSAQATVGQAASMMLNSAQPNFAVLDPYNGEFLGVATSAGVAQAMQRGEWHQRITEIMHHARSIPKIALNAPLDEVQDLLSGASNPVVAVYDGLHFRGLITANDIYRVFRFLSQSSRAAARWPA
jgi:stage IV sporulation protein FB